MLLTVHRTAGFLFYTFGVCVLILLMLMQRGVIPDTPVLHSLDLPLIGAALTYGGISLYRSIHRPGRSSRAVAIVIAIVLFALFACAAYLNFWFPIGVFAY